MEPGAASFFDTLNELVDTFMHLFTLTIDVKFNI